MYEVAKLGASEFSFDTIHGLQYRVSFGDGSGYFSPKWVFSRFVSVFSFQIMGHGNAQIPMDSNVKFTIASILNQFFESRPHSLVFFMYDGSDGRALSRQRKFDGWYREIGMATFRKFDASIPIDRITIQASVLVRNDNPHLAEIADSFDAIVIESTAKPDSD